MGESEDADAGFDDPGRRQFLVKAAAVGAIAWTAPAIITMQPAGAAALTSPPPEPPEVAPNEISPPTDPATEVAGATASSGQLPVTGADVEQLLIAGLAATAGGAAMQFWSSKLGTRSGGPPDPAPPAPSRT